MRTTEPLKIERIIISSDGVVVFAKQPQFRTGVMTRNGPVGVRVWPKIVQTFQGNFSFDWISKFAVGDMITVHFKD